MSPIKRALVSYATVIPVGFALGYAWEKMKLPEWSGYLLAACWAIVLSVVVTTWILAGEWPWQAFRGRNGR
jgi:hypothetical protein